MKRALVTAVTILALALPGVAFAKVVTLGGDTPLPTPSCPTNPCLAVARTTGFQLSIDGKRNPFAATAEGRLVAFTLAMSKPTAKQVSFFNSALGGKSSARIAILRPYRKTNNNFRYVLNAQSEPFALQPYFGTTRMFALRKSLLVRKGYVVALTVPTWAPVLVTGLANTSFWRASRGKPCSQPGVTERQPPHTDPGTVKQYFCQYSTTRLSYSATIITPEP